MQEKVHRYADSRAGLISLLPHAPVFFVLLAPFGAPPVAPLPPLGALRLV